MEVECEIAEYVYDAFDVGAFQYLLKPIDEQRFAGFWPGGGQRKKKIFTLYSAEAQKPCAPAGDYLEVKAGMEFDRGTIRQMERC